MSKKQTYFYILAAGIITIAAGYLMPVPAPYPKWSPIHWSLARPLFVRLFLWEIHAIG